MIQHNPFGRDGYETPVRWAENFLSENPNGRTAIVRTIAEGDFVVTHSHVTAGPHDL